MTNENADLTAKKQQKRVIGKPFKKGQSGNPAGRPLGSISITTEIKKKLQEVPDGQKKTYLELLINRILKLGVVDGNEQMIKAIWNYIDGLPAQKLDLGGNLIINVEKEVAEKYANTKPKNNSEGQPQI